jgi:hypothetical protein
MTHYTLAMDNTNAMKSLPQLQPGATPSMTCLQQTMGHYKQLYTTMVALGW